MEPPPANLDTIARELRGALAGCPALRLAILFGSWTRGLATPDSDVDLAILGPGIDRLELAATLGRRLGKSVDIIALETADIPLLREIVLHGIVVHEGTRGSAASWRSHTLADLEIDGPWYARMRDAWLERVARTGIRNGEP